MYNKIVSDINQLETDDYTRAFLTASYHFARLREIEVKDHYGQRLDHMQTKQENLLKALSDKQKVINGLKAHINKLDANNDNPPPADDVLVEKANENAVSLKDEILKQAPHLAENLQTRKQ